MPKLPRATLSQEALDADYFSDFTENNITNLEVEIYKLPKGSKKRQYLEDEHARIKNQIDSGEYFRRQLYAGDFDPKPIGKYLTPQAEATEPPSNLLLRGLGRGLEATKGVLNRFPVPEVPVTPFNAMEGLKKAVEAGWKKSSGLGDVMVGNADREVGRWAYGDSPFKMPKANSSIPYIPEGRKKDVADAIGFLPLAPGIGDNVALSAVKGKGGAWSAKTQQNLTGEASREWKEFLLNDAIKRKVSPVIKNDLNRSLLDHNEIDDWFDNAFTKYRNKYLGTPDDPLKDIRLNSGDPDGHIVRWEDMIDNHVKEQTGGFDVRTYLGRTDKEWFAYNADFAIDTSFFKEVKEYMSNVPEAKRQQYSFPRAVQETIAWQEKMAREAAKKNNWKNIPEKLMEGNTVTKEYPDGRKWTTLDQNKPVAFARQSCVFGNCIGQAANDGKTIWYAADPDTGFPLWTKENKGKDGFTTTKASKYDYQYSNQQPGPEWTKFDKNGYMYDDITIHTLRDKDSKTQVMISTDIEPLSPRQKQLQILPGHEGPQKQTFSISQIKGHNNGVISPEQRDAVIDFINTHNIQSIKEGHDRWPGIIATYDPDSRRMFAMTREEAMDIIKRSGSEYRTLNDNNEWVFDKKAYDQMSDKRIEHYLETVIIPNRRK
jgi:hypothetical protein